LFHSGILWLSAASLCQLKESVVTGRGHTIYRAIYILLDIQKRREENHKDDTKVWEHPDASKSINVMTTMNAYIFGFNGSLHTTIDNIILCG
jgi:hypothetical protein